MKVALFVAMFFSIFLAIFFSMIGAFGKQGKADRDAARERRLAEHKMNARLLRLDI